MTGGVEGWAMLLRSPGGPLAPVARRFEAPHHNEILIRVEACGVCRTDLHLLDGELPQASYPVVPGHEVVGVVEASGMGAPVEPGERVGMPWLAYACGRCWYCRMGRENLCDEARFTGCNRDGGYASHLLADGRFCLALGAGWSDPARTAPHLCAGLIGWRALQAAGPARRLALYGFGAAAHIVVQLARWQGSEVFAFTRPGDSATATFALSLGASWAGGSDQAPPEPFDAAIIFAPVGALVPSALRHLRKGGRVVCAGIHMSDIPAFPYSLLWQERQIVSVANLTRLDGVHYLRAALEAGVETRTTVYPLAQANKALDDLRRGAFEGAAVLVPD